MKYSFVIIIMLFGIGVFCNSYKESPSSIDFGGGSSSKNSYSATVNIKDIHGISTSKNYSAAFGYIPQLKNVNIETATLTMVASPEAGGTTTPTGETNMFSGQTQTITATPASSYLFDKWTANGMGTLAKPTDMETTVTVFGNVTVTANFLKASINVISPQGGEEWPLGSLQTISWSSENVSTNVKIELMQNGELYYIIASDTENSGTYSWQVPSFLAQTSTYQVRISAADRPDIAGQSAAAFTIPFVKPSILAVTSPNGGNIWQHSTEQLITWTTDIKSGYLSIILLENGIFHSYISQATPNSGSYSWLIPSSLANGDNYQISISGNDFSLSDRSDSFFSITSSAPSSETITVTAPASNNVWAPGSNQQISWTTTNISSTTVSIDLFKDNLLLQNIATSIPNNSIYNWAIPASLPAASNYRVKISTASSFGFSNNFFTITSTPTATLTLAAQPVTGGTTTASTTLATGTAYSIEATPASGFKFLQWSPSTNARVTDPFSQKTDAFLVADASITALFAEETVLKTATIKIKTNKDNADSIDLKNALIDLSEFIIGSDIITIRVEHETFLLDQTSGIYAQKGKKQVYTYKTNKDILPKINFTLDLEKGFWKFKATKIDELQETIDSSDGVEFFIQVSRADAPNYSYSNSFKLTMDKTVKWTFNNQKDSFSTPLGNNFLINRMNGKINSKKSNADTFKITKATLSNTIDFNPQSDSVMLLLDNTWFETISDLTQSGKNQTYKWKGQLTNQPGTLSATFNIDKGTWNMSLSKSDLSSLSAFDGICVKLNISTYTGEQRIYPAETITLKYKAK